MNREESEEIKRHFGVVAEGLRSEVRLVAEAVEGLRSELHRELGEFRKEVQAEFKEVRALIRFSYAELDERVKSLESGFLELKSRMERLERDRA